MTDNVISSNFFLWSASISLPNYAKQVQGGQKLTERVWSVPARHCNHIFAWRNDMHGWRNEMHAWRIECANDEMRWPTVYITRTRNIEAKVLRSSSCLLSDCEMSSEWSSWSACSRTCDNGIRYRQQTAYNISATCVYLGPPSTVTQYQSCSSGTPCRGEHVIIFQRNYIHVCAL